MASVGSPVLSRRLKAELMPLVAFSFCVLFSLYVFTNTDFSAPWFAAEPEIKAAVNPYRMHGERLGYRWDGQPGWVPKPRPPADVDMAEELLANGFFYRLSESLPLDRNVTDQRHKQCSHVQHDYSKLPATSVIFVFYNEAMSTLLRSIHSVLNRTPRQLLLEIVLVDDCSDKQTHPWLGRDLEEYVALLPKVRLVRNPVRSGLVKARLRGAREARAETFTVLDSHIEVQPGWLEPMMQRIAQGRHHVMMPIIDSMDPERFEAKPGGIGCTLGFLWTLTEHGISIQKKDRERRTSEVDYVRSPAMAGGLFSIHREFFWEIGGYDEDFGFWGTENLEFSFRIWQCGGTLECAPCSRVYHLFRKGGAAYSLPHGHLQKNKLRTARIWMDKFGFIVEDALGNPDTPVGSLDKMLALKERLQCKPFSWYLENVYPEAMITDLDQIQGYGFVRHMSARKCLDTNGDPEQDDPVFAQDCYDDDTTQRFMFLGDRGLRPIRDLELCIMQDLKFQFCEWEDPEAIGWTYDRFRKLIRHTAARLCLDVDIDGDLIVTECSASAKWELQQLGHQ